MPRPIGKERQRKKPKRLTKPTACSPISGSGASTTNSSQKPGQGLRHHSQAQRIHLPHNRLLKRSQQGRIALNVARRYMGVAIVRVAKGCPRHRKAVDQLLAERGQSTFPGPQTLGMRPYCAVLFLLLLPFSLRSCELCGSPLCAPWSLRRYCFGARYSGFIPYFAVCALWHLCAR